MLENAVFPLIVSGEHLVHIRKRPRFPDTYCEMLPKTNPRWISQQPDDPAVVYGSNELPFVPGVSDTCRCRNVGAKMEDHNGGGASPSTEVTSRDVESPATPSARDIIDLLHDNRERL